MANLKLMTSDEIPILIDFETIKCSNLIRDVVENYGFTNEVIPLSVDYSVMQLVLKWAVHHKDDPPVRDDYTDLKMDINEIPEWDKKYFDMGQGELLELIRAANYLHIPKLIEYCYKTVALFISGKTATEMRHIFDIDKDDDKKEVGTQKEIDNDLECGTHLSSDAEPLLKKRKIAD